MFARSPARIVLAGFAPLGSPATPGADVDKNQGQPSREKLTDEQRTKRDALEFELKKLKEQRGTLGEETYYTKLEKLLRQLSEVYGSARPAT